MNPAAEGVAEATTVVDMMIAEYRPGWGSQQVEVGPLQ